jgi:hypothetical protein
MPAIAVDFEIDIGVGGAGSEVVIATFKGGSIDNNLSPAFFPCIIPIDSIANGARIATRLRKSDTTVTTWGIAVTYLLKPITGTLLVTVSPLLCVPTGAVGTTLTAGTSWVSGAWVQMIASTSSAIVVPQIMAFGIGIQEGEIDIGVGGAGSEVVVTTFRYFQLASAGGAGAPFNLYLPNPLDNIGNGVRVAARHRSATGAHTLKLAIMYHAKPL